MVDFLLKIHRKLINFEHKNDHISKTKNHQNWKIDFSFGSAFVSHCGTTFFIPKDAQCSETHAKTVFIFLLIF